ncbi:AsnC family transcriptional regulator [Leifsonia aquatica]|uniref:AsnC family transcriptional regulator n=1 Tax=Leifsonia aquatica TaxID=144185 RepID=UPI0037F3BEB7
MAISTDFDELDSRIAAALQANGRASWGLIAKVIDAPVRTIARRGQRLLDVGAVRVSELDHLVSVRVGTVLKFFRSGDDWTAIPLPPAVLAQLRNGEEPAPRAGGQVTLSAEGRIVETGASDRLTVDGATSPRTRNFLSRVL